MWNGLAEPDSNLIDNALHLWTSDRHPAGECTCGDPGTIRLCNFRTQLAVGFSFTPTESRITLQPRIPLLPGLASRDRIGTTGSTPEHAALPTPGISRTLWYIRSYALDQQVPVSQHSGFLRADWVDAFVPDLELTALANVNLLDGSGLVQATADYYLSRCVDDRRSGQLHLRTTSLRIWQPATGRRLSASAGALHLTRHHVTPRPSADR